MSIGTSLNHLIKDTTDGLAVNEHGGIIVNEDGLSSHDNVWAGKDAVAIAARAINKELSSE